MRHPPRPTADSGVLLPRIIAHERIHLPCFHTELCLNDLPCGARPPYRLQGVLTCGRTNVRLSCTPDRLCLQIPLMAQLCDACGKAYSIQTSTDAEIRAPRCMTHNCHHLLWAEPEVCLLDCSCTEGCCFHAALCLGGNLYLLHMEPCTCRPPKPACPPLPLYPPPMY